MAASSSDTTPESGSTLKTPWPPASRSTSSPSGGGQDRAVVGQHQLGRGEVDAEVPAQALDGLAGLLQLHAGVEQSLDDLELEHVAVGVPPLAARAGGVGDRRAEQVGAGPVVELPVGDADDGAHLGAAEALGGTGRRRSDGGADGLLGTSGRLILGHAILHLDQSFTVT